MQEKLNFPLSLCFVWANIIPRDRSYSSAIPACTESALDWTILRLYTSFNSIVVATEPEHTYIQIREKGQVGRCKELRPCATIIHFIIERRSESAPKWRHTASRRDFIGVDMAKPLYERTRRGTTHIILSYKLCNFVDVVATQENQQHIWI